MAKKPQGPIRPGRTTKADGTPLSAKYASQLQREAHNRAVSEAPSRRAEILAGNAPRSRANESIRQLAGEQVGSRANEQMSRYAVPNEAIATVGRGVIPRGTPAGAVSSQSTGVRNVFKSLGADQDRANTFVRRLRGGY